MAESAAAAAAAKVSPDDQAALQLKAEIDNQGQKVRELKSAGADKVIDYFYMELYSYMLFVRGLE